MKVAIGSIRLRQTRACLGLCFGLGLGGAVNASDIPAACPNAEAWIQTHKLLKEKEGKASIAASDVKLHSELMQMAQEDTVEREALMKSQGQERVQIKRMEGSDAKHLAALHRIAPNGVLPDIHVMGTDGMSALLLLVQHANGDPTFQRTVLKNLGGRVQKGEISGESYALLTDRVLMQNNEPQIYGTQMTVDNNVVHLYKVDAPSGLEQRRKNMGLMPMKDYECVISMSYKMSFDPSDASASIGPAETSP